MGHGEPAVVADLKECTESPAGAWIKKRRFKQIAQANSTGNRNSAEKHSGKHSER